jgi:hypothetical protein
VAAAELEFDRVLEAARADARVLGLLLGGSRGKDPAYVTEHSDYDVYLIVADQTARDEYARRFPSSHGDPVEVILATLDSFRSHALPGSGSEWNAYTFAHVTPLIDRLDGEIACLTEEKARRDPATAAPPLLDAYINSLYRAAKNHRDGLLLEAHLDAAESIAWLVDFLFAACGRVRPYNKWLVWELRRHPLPEPWSGDRLVPAVAAVLRSGDLGAQQGLFRDVERFARALGYGDVVDGWEPDLDWLRGSEA